MSKISKYIALIIVTVGMAVFAFNQKSEVSVNASSSTYISAMPTAYRHTWYRQNQKIRFTAHTLSFGTVGHKFYAANKFKKVLYVKKSSRGKYLVPMIQADIPAFKGSKGHLYVLDQQGKWERYHR